MASFRTWRSARSEGIEIDLNIAHTARMTNSLARPPVES
jgi:hypothetical protein